MIKRSIRRGLVMVLALAFLATSALAASYTTLRFRDEGEDVRRMQQALVSLGYSTGGVDGKFGPTTEKAVRQFQRDNGLTVDGLAGSRTLTLLYDLADGGAPSTPTRPPVQDDDDDDNDGSGLFGGNYATLSYGARGERVKILQRALNQLGYSAGSADGKFGSGTQRAVIQFQRDNGLTPDGLAGRKTLQKIERLAGGGSTNPPTSAPTSTPNNDGYVVPSRTLRPGDRGNDVRSVQSRLKELGYYSGSLDGYYGSGTTEAVRLFQSRNRLTVDGIAGSGTYRVLFSGNAQPAVTPSPTPTASPTPTPTPDYDDDVPSRTLRLGDSGSDVRSVQSRLKELGYYTGYVDGNYGVGTAEAVRSFQSRHRLTVDGVAGPGTYRILFSANAQPAPSASPEPTDEPDPDAYPILRKGSTGPAVLRLQNALADLGYTVNTTGTYTSETVTAVRKFQQNNGLVADGVAGSATQTKLYSGSAVGPSESGPTLPPGAGTGVRPPATSQVQLLHWQNDIKPNLERRAHFLVLDPDTGLSWTLQLLSAGRHADSEPLTAQDTAIMYRAFGNQNTWNQKAVYVRLPDGRWTIGSTHNVPHLSGNIANNNFDGHLCLHLLRDMSEAERNDPNYGVSNQNTIRQFWKELTGEEIPYR